MLRAQWPEGGLFRSSRKLLSHRSQDWLSGDGHDGKGFELLATAFASKLVEITRVKRSKLSHRCFAVPRTVREVVSKLDPGEKLSSRHGKT